MIIMSAYGSQTVFLKKPRFFLFKVDCRQARV